MLGRPPTSISYTIQGVNIPTLNAHFGGQLFQCAHSLSGSWKYWTFGICCNQCGGFCACFSMLNINLKFVASWWNPRHQLRCRGYKDWNSWCCCCKLHLPSIFLKHSHFEAFDNTASNLAQLRQTRDGGHWKHYQRNLCQTCPLFFACEDSI